MFSEQKSSDINSGEKPFVKGECLSVCIYMFEPLDNHCLVLYNPTTLQFTTTSVQNEMYLYTYLQHTYRELKLLHQKPSLSHRKQLTMTLRAMDSSCMFQKMLCQQKYQKHNWMCKLACLAIFRCLLSYIVPYVIDAVI